MADVDVTREQMIARLRSELSTLRAAHDKLVAAAALSEAERAVVDARMAQFVAIDEEARQVCVLRTLEACDALLALRKDTDAIR